MSVQYTIRKTSFSWWNKYLCNVLKTHVQHEKKALIFSAVILFLLLIQGGQLSGFGEGMCTSTGKWLRGLSLPRKSGPAHHDLNSVDWAVKSLPNQQPTLCHWHTSKAHLSLPICTV